MKQFVKFFICVLVCCSVFNSECHAQYVNTWKDGHLTFVTKEMVDSEGDEDETDYDAGNDDVGINMEIMTYNDFKMYYQNLEQASSEGCIEMELELRKIGGPFLNFHQSHYSLCYDSEHEHYIINAVIYRTDVQKVYDIALYCYTISIEEGLDVLKSFKFLDK